MNVCNCLLTRGIFSQDLSVSLFQTFLIIQNLVQNFYFFFIFFFYYNCLFFFSKTNTNEDPFLCAKCVIPKTNHLDHGIPLCEKCATDSIVTRLYCTSVRILCSIFNNLDTETTYAILLGQFFQTFSVCRWPFRSLLGSCSGVLSFFLYDLDIDRS